MANNGATPAIAALKQAGIGFTEHAYDHEPTALSYGMEAANALGRDPRQVFKTLMVTDPSDQRKLAVAIVPVNVSLDLKAMAVVLGLKKVTMAPVDVAERTSGYVAGGISPLGQRRELPCVIDSSAREWLTILVSGGKRGLDIEIASSDLIELLQAIVHPVATR